MTRDHKQYGFLKYAPIKLLTPGRSLILSRRVIGTRLQANSLGRGTTGVTLLAFLVLNILLHSPTICITFGATTAAAAAAATPTNVDAGLLLMISGHSRFRLRFLFLTGGLRLHSDVPVSFRLCFLFDTEVIVTL